MATAAPLTGILPARSSTSARRARLLALLADGAFHSGERLAKRLRISRSSVGKLIRSLRELGIDIQSVPGYRLPCAVDLLSEREVNAALSATSRDLIERTDVLLSVASTNRYIAENAMHRPGRGQVCLSEVQTAGRGRRGRSWVAPFGSGICLSIGWQFAAAPPTFAALSLAVGVAVVKALQRFGVRAGVKWPNDLIWQQRKLGGVLIEMRGESAGQAQVVIGIGLNIKMPAAIRIALAEQQSVLIADVHEMLRDRTPTRNQLAAALVDEVIGMLQTFASRGFEPFIEDWRRLDALCGAAVKVISGTATIFGTARGVDQEGTLLLDVGGKIQRFVSGEVSLRAVR